MESLLHKFIEEVNDILKPYKDSNRNFLGSDVSKQRLKQIISLSQGKDTEDPSVHELAFWRWVAFEGYEGIDPRLFKYKQTLLMLGAFHTTGWVPQSFKEKHILEVGCGPYGMIEIFPKESFRVAFDPLNDEYDRLFHKIRSKSINYTTDWKTVTDNKQGFDLVICFNVLDHTGDPEGVLAQTMRALKSGGQFLIQVNTVRDGYERTEEHKKMHPSEIKVNEIQELISGYCNSCKCDISNTPSALNEFWFMAWGHKK
ncbi:MAG: methyltransferase domain-containing protein [Phycisphaerales bacterium]|nr:MAG: methyltransferase domain-containing protein [Phycisphaerales bacterium]